LEFLVPGGRVSSISTLEPSRQISSRIPGMSIELIFFIE